ncbi:hypothetical protein [Vibrio mexicanus]|uniref:hypothetical protein n=1 Tax=Vibrio mexicanus TaxID=1004326 RepID=UPI00063C0839|nr:hypothetical protein [Vibrio mexicanus]
MYAQVEKSKKNRNKVVANSVVQKKSNVRKNIVFMDNRSNKKYNHTMQLKFVGDDADWMGDVSDQVILDKFGSTTGDLWKALRDSGDLVIVRGEGSGGSFSFNEKKLTISKNWLDAVKDYVNNGKVSPFSVGQYQLLLMSCRMRTIIL